MKTSEQINEVATALAAAQGEFPAIAKLKQATVKGVSKTSGKEFSISYAYADIADVLGAVIPVLSKHKLALIQPTVIDGSTMTILTRIIHASGQWIESEYPVCSLQGDHQKMGGALTYGRRYALCTMLGVAADEDTDGQEAAEPAPKHRAVAERPTVTSGNGASRQASATPFDEGPSREPVAGAKGIAMAREVKACKSLDDLEALKRTPEFTAFWKAANEADRAEVMKAVDRLKSLYAADLIAAE